MDEPKLLPELEEQKNSEKVENYNLKDPTSSESPSLQFIEIKENKITQFKNEDKQIVKVLKISRKKSLDKIQDTPPATEGELAPSHTRSSGSLVQAQLSCPTNIHPPRIPANLPPSRKRKVLENSRLSKNENAMKTFKFKNVDELDAKSVKSSSYQKEKSQNQDTLSQQPEQPQQKVTESYIQDVFEKIGLAQQAVDRAVNHRS